MKDKGLTPRDPTGVAAVYVRQKADSWESAKAIVGISHLLKGLILINLEQRSVIFDGEKKWDGSKQIDKWIEATNMRVIEEIVSEENINEAIKKVKSNKGVAGVDKMTVYEIEEYFSKHREEIVQSIFAKKYKPQPVKRVPQGGPLSPIVSNIQLDKLDKELEERGLSFARYADDCNIFVKSANSC